MEWEGGRRGGGVEDRRGLSAGHYAAGGGIGVGVIALIGYFFFGIDPNTTEQVLSQGGLGGASVSQQQGSVGTPQDQAGQFVDVIGTNIDDVWATQIKGYTPPKTVIYDQGTQTGCGFGQTAMGPFYCPNDQTVYLDLSFWQEMGKLGGDEGDFARAYVIAHEFGHHVQKLVGTSDKVEQAEQRAGGRGQANKYSVALELQADCFAGVWAAHASDVSSGKVKLDPGDLEKGLKTANAIGDDTLQKNATGHVTPEGFTHGTSAQRVEWLKKGYTTGDPKQCDTFGGL